MGIPEMDESRPYELIYHEKRMECTGSRITRKFCNEVSDSESFEVKEELGYVLKFKEVKDVKKTKFNSLKKNKTKLEELSNF